MEKYLKQLLDLFEKNAIKTYLILANVILACFAIWFANVGFLPFKNAGDFGFFVVLCALLALYRPGWAFTLFIGSLALENINLAPVAFGVQIRPFQLLLTVLILALLGRYLTKKMPAPKGEFWPKWTWIDLLPVLFVVGGFVSALASVNKGMSFKQAIVAASFVGIYFLTRIFVQSFEDLKRIAPFFLSTGVVVCLYAIWQNLAFSYGWNSFEVMPGRPNGTFVEADWLGVYIVFLLAIVLSMFHLLRKKSSIMSCQSSSCVFLYVFLFLIFITLFLTVSRSAWIGAVIVIFGYLKLALFYGKSDSQKVAGKFWGNFWILMKQKWNWIGWLLEFGKIFLIVLVAVGFIYIFKLTSFQLGQRAQSTGGLQKITISCEIGKSAPEKIAKIEELEAYSCKYINLEDIDREMLSGRVIQEVSRPDPNVGIRASIYRVVFEQIKSHPVLGTGWGSISEILGNDSRGAGLNASNLFLEVWLGSGLIGFLSLVILFGYIFVFSIFSFVKSKGENFDLVFVMLGLFAIIIPNLFNSGIFLGFVWVFLGVAVGLLLNKE
ncbi:MAG: hypothetical protein ACD_8C00046G0001 [uncultured bacterium]|nr:MAG: hypothetical protein ACD_8C00046G0001 [uncultured bacterium]